MGFPSSNRKEKQFNCVPCVLWLCSTRRRPRASLVFVAFSSCWRVDPSIGRGYPPPFHWIGTRRKTEGLIHFSVDPFPRAVFPTSDKFRDDKVHFRNLHLIIIIHIHHIIITIPSTWPPTPQIVSVRFLNCDLVRVLWSFLCYSLCYCGLRWIINFLLSPEQLNYLLHFRY